MHTSHASPAIENRTPRSTLKAHGNKRSSGNQYRYTRRTLGVGIRHAVSVPPGERLWEWMATNTIDFYHAICLLVGIVADENEMRLEPGRGFPPGFEYLWADTSAKRTIKCNGPQYIDLVLNWVQGVINDKNVFPSTALYLPSSADQCPRDYEKTCKAIFKRLFRVFAILYTHHYSRMESMGAVAHLNTTFKHFMFFCFEFDLVPAAELEAIDILVTRLREEYQSGEHASSSSSSSSSSSRVVSVPSRPSPPSLSSLNSALSFGPSQSQSQSQSLPPPPPSPFAAPPPHDNTAHHPASTAA